MGCTQAWRRGTGARARGAGQRFRTGLGWERRRRGAAEGMCGGALSVREVRPRAGSRSGWAGAGLSEAGLASGGRALEGAESGPPLRSVPSLSFPFLQTKPSLKQQGARRASPVLSQRRLHR